VKRRHRWQQHRYLKMAVNLRGRQLSNQRYERYSRITNKYGSKFAISAGSGCLFGKDLSYVSPVRHKTWTPQLADEWLTKRGQFTLPGSITLAARMKLAACRISGLWSLFSLETTCENPRESSGRCIQAQHCVEIDPGSARRSVHCFFVLLEKMAGTGLQPTNIFLIVA
jgi:hypothetical protein